MRLSFETRKEKVPKRKSVKVSSKNPTLDVVGLQRLGCDGCGLNDKRLNSPRMLPTGPVDAEIYVLGEAPGRDEDDQGQQFVGKSGRLLRKNIANMNVRFDNCVRCRPPNNRTPTADEIARCSGKVLASIEACKPRVVLGVGGVALETMLHTTGIQKWRGRQTPIKVGDHVCWFRPIIHPAFVLRQSEDAFAADWSGVFKTDLKFTNKVLLGGLGEPHFEDVSDVYDGVIVETDSAKAVKLMEQTIVESDVVAIDIETTCLRPYDDDARILSFALSDGNATVATVFDDVSREWLQFFLTHCTCALVAHNLAFELEWLMVEFGNIGRPELHDTMAQAYCLDNRGGNLSLDFLCIEHFGLHLKDISNVDLSRLIELPVKDLLSYNALDAKYTAWLFYLQRHWIFEEGLDEAYTEHVRRIPTLVRTQMAGLHVDSDLVENLWLDYTEKLDKLQSKFRILDDVQRYEASGSVFKPSSPKAVLELMNSRGFNITSTDEKTLKALDDPVAQQVLDFRSCVKLRSTYIEGVRSGGKYVYDDLLIHTQFNGLFTRTGRLSSDSPNMQNWPKRQHAEIRALVCAPPGSVMVSLDWKQLEVCVIAAITRDACLLNAMRMHEDIHAVWIEKLYEIHPAARDWDNVRMRIKTDLVFPAFYGAKSRSIAKSLGVSRGRVSLLMREFWDLYAGVSSWQEDVLADYEKVGYVECQNGRRRYAPLTVEQLYNTPIQGSASDIVVDAMCRLSEKSVATGVKSFQPVLNIHDDLTFYIEEAKLEEHLETIIREILVCPFSWMDIPLAVDISTGPNWFDQKSIGTFYSDEL